jgi:hypothetical protein
MCNQLFTLTSGSAPVGRYFRLCSKAPKHVAEILTKLQPASASGIGKNPVFEACVMACARATHLLVEHDYFDSDFRSNAGLLAARRYQAVALRTNRLIFLHTDEPNPTIFDVSGTLDAIHKSKPIGYITLTPEPGAEVGRSILPAPPSLPGVKIEIDHAVRTTVHETITVFGKHAEVTGVPFIQQDGHLITCAHASAWMAHYAGVLRGLCARRATADFHTDNARSLLIGRHHPSDGLTSWQVATTLEHFGLPAVSMTLLDFTVEGHLAGWYDREEIWTLTDELKGFSNSDSKDYIEHIKALDRVKTKESKSFQETLEIFWLRESLTKIICQHLNSGFPCVLLNRRHAKVITGYMRARDMTPKGPCESDLTAVVAFLASDDQVGPYTVATVDDIVRDLRTKYSDGTLLIPLAPGIWVNGPDAELGGARAFAAGITRARQAIESGAKNCVFHTPGSEALNQIKGHESAIATSARPGNKNRGLALRSYVVPATDFKDGFARRCTLDPVAVAQVRLAKLPKFVWVVEVLDRGAREKDMPSVVGEVVLDATEFDLIDTKTLILHLPGVIQVRGESGPGKWHVTNSVGLYDSGRYHRKNDWMNEPSALTARWKTAHV